jgi:hypothetical protein
MEVDAVYLEFAKPFDSVPHERLLLKLSTPGIKGNLLGWIRDSLQGRVQRVHVEGALSSWNPVISGVPQGSVLGPVLFLCYVHYNLYMPENVKTSIKQFADDTKISAPANNIEEHQIL